jgi:cytochrome P450
MVALALHAGRATQLAERVIVEPLDFAGPWPYPWSRLSQLALEADLEVDELRAYLEREVERRRAEEEVGTDCADLRRERLCDCPLNASTNSGWNACWTPSSP